MRLWQKMTKHQRKLSNWFTKAYIKVVDVQTIEYTGLHRGEAEAITLAKNIDCWVVLDDLKARKIARREGVKIIGTLGILKLLRERVKFSQI
jgi:predicted nucleic acid-binding protein